MSSSSRMYSEGQHSLVNELAILCDRMGIDVWEVVQQPAKPFGFMPFCRSRTGRHCTAIDPFYLSWRARSFEMTTEFIELAGGISINMPHYAGRRGLNAEKKPVNGSRV